MKNKEKLRGYAALKGKLSLMKIGLLIAVGK